MRIVSGGRYISIVSRISASGLDYTGRTNKFAHHIALEDHERPPGGPAWLLSQPGFLESAWDGQVRLLHTGRAVPLGDSTPRVARAWESCVGDPGWAGVLAETFLEDPTRLIYLIFRPGMALLPLFAEAELLLPPEKRWQVGFNTFYTNLPPGISCPWLGVAADSPEVAEARRISRSLIIDLTQPLGRAKGGELVERARTGRGPERVMPPPPRPAVSPPPVMTLPQARAATRPGHGSHHAGGELTPATQSPAGYDLGPAAQPSVPRPVPPPLRRSVAPSQKSSSAAAIAMSVAAAGLLLVTGYLLYGMFTRSGSREDHALASSSEGTSTTGGAVGGGVSGGSTPSPGVSGGGAGGQASGGQRAGTHLGGFGADALVARRITERLKAGKRARRGRASNPEMIYKGLPPIKAGADSPRVKLFRAEPPIGTLSIKLVGLADEDLSSSLLKIKQGKDADASPRSSWSMTQAPDSAARPTWLGSGSRDRKCSSRGTQN